MAIPRKKSGTGGGGGQEPPDALAARARTRGPARRGAYERDLAAAEREYHAAEHHLAEARKREALSWEEEDLQAAMVEVFDSIGKRIARLFH